MKILMCRLSLVVIFVAMIAMIGIPVKADVPPVAVNDHYHTDYRTILIIPAPGVLGNDTGTEASAKR